jgi:uncharacterized protein
LNAISCCRPLLPLILMVSLSACARSDNEAPAPASSAKETPAAVEAVAEAVAATPPPDCAGSGSEAEKLVCADPSLAALDKEVARVFALAQADSYLTPESAAELNTLQQDWVKGRNDCLQAEDKQQCLVDSYARRIHQLRQGSPNARKPDPQGVSIGPLPLACKDTDFAMGMTVIAIEPGYAFLEYLDKKITFSAVPEVPEARYSASSSDGDYSLVTQAREVRFTAPGQPEVTCTIEEPDHQ